MQGEVGDPSYLVIILLVIKMGGGGRMVCGPLGSDTDSAFRAGIADSSPN